MSKVEVFAQSKEEFASSVIFARTVCDKTIKQYMTLAGRIIGKIKYDDLMRLGEEKEVFFAAIDNYIANANCKIAYPKSDSLNDEEVKVFLDILKRDLLDPVRKNAFQRYVDTGRYDIEAKKAPREPSIPSVLQGAVDVKKLTDQEVENILRQRTAYNVEMAKYEDAVEEYKERRFESKRKFWEIAEYLGNLLGPSENRALPASALKIIAQQVKDEEHATREQDLEDFCKQVSFVRKCLVDL